MVKKSRRQVRRLKQRLPAEAEQEESRSQDSQDSVSQDDDSQEQEEPTGDELTQKFGLKGINDEAGLEERLKEVQGSFYNRLESARLIKKQGKIPFTEHMTVAGATVVVPTELAVH